jgi:pantoate--beta-alanine ligase
MGSLHKGHVSLIKKSNSQCKKTIVSIFINKPQFNKITDFKKYPRTLSKDIEILKKLKIDFLYLPSPKQIYPNGVNLKIKLHQFSKVLCGKSRPGHFKAVVDVIDRFVKIINPTKIFLGEKDFQQLKLIEHFLTKNKSKTSVVLCKTIRESSGLAYSSRNVLLSINEKKIASKIYNFLLKEKRNLIKNKTTISDVKNILFKIGLTNIDYLSVMNVNKIIRPHKKKKKFKIFIAYYLRKTRLIDNI